MKITIRNAANEIIVEGDFKGLREALIKNKVDLSGANLSDVNLSGAKNCDYLNIYTLNNYIDEFKIKRQGQYIFAYKGVDKDYCSPTQGNKIKYTIGSIISVDRGNRDIFTDCGHGINLSPTKELAEKWGTKTVQVKIDIGDIICIPVAKEKFRVSKCEVIKEVAR